MTITEEVQSMMQQNRSESDIIAAMQKKGASQNEIVDAITQAKIKNAVNSPEDSENPPVHQPTGYEGMEPSILNPASMSESAPTQEYSPEQYAQLQQYSPNYQQQDQEQNYQQYAPGMSSDTISEIAEQVVSEKMAPIRAQLEKAIDLKNTVESKIEYIDERLSRIEKIIDRLQLSILQRVGEYVTNVEDIKKELVETQKSFKSISDKKK